MTCNEISGVRCTTEASRVEPVDQRVIIALDEEFGVGGANLLSISITQTYIIYIFRIDRDRRKINIEKDK